jgi:hypothetical protein
MEIGIQIFLLLQFFSPVSHSSTVIFHAMSVWDTIKIQFMYLAKPE